MRNKLFVTVLAGFLCICLFAQGAIAATLLRLGSRGQEVYKMQQKLKEYGYLSGAVDGIFGRQTLEAVKKFQAANGLVVDGIAGPKTLSKLYQNPSANPGNSNNNSGSKSEASAPINRILKLGSRGEDVRMLQNYLNALGFSVGKADGIFGPATRNAVINFQRSRGLAVDGIVGPATIAAINAALNNKTNPNNGGDSKSGASAPINRLLKLGSRGEDVKTLQKQLNALGFSVGKVDGIFGPATRNAVISFQRSRGLVVDGIVGPATVAAINAALNQTGKDDNKPGDGGKNDGTGDKGSGETGFTPWKPASGKINLVWDRNLVPLKYADGVNVIAPVWFSVRQINGTITVDSSKASKSYVDQAHKMGYKVWATIQSFTPSISKQVVHNEAVANHVISKLKELVQAYNLDGINIDFENMDPADKDLYTRFVEKAVKQLHTVGATVSVDITRRTSSPTNWWSACYDRTGLAKVADYIILMSYDQHSSSSKTNGPVASIGWVENSVQITLEEVPANKLLIGIPLYAYDWISEPIVSQPDPANPAHYRRVGNGVALTMGEIEQLITTNSATLRNGSYIQVAEWLVKPTWLDQTGTMYLKFLDTQGKLHELWYEDARSIKLKLDLVYKYGLAGAASWEYTFANDKIWEVFKERLSR